LKISGIFLMDVQTIIEFLKQAPDEQILDILEEVFKNRRPNPEEDEHIRNKYFLGTASSTLSDAGEWEPWDIDAVAYPDREAYDLGATLGQGVGPDWGFCQSGTCLSCGISVRSNLKHGICPVCNEKVYMT
jgi:hypothetical protein